MYYGEIGKQLEEYYGRGIHDLSPIFWMAFYFQTASFFISLVRKNPLELILAAYYLVWEWFAHYDN